MDQRGYLEDCRVPRGAASCEDSVSDCQADPLGVCQHGEKLHLHHCTHIRCTHRIGGDGRVYTIHNRKTMCADWKGGSDFWGEVVEAQVALVACSRTSAMIKSKQQIYKSKSYRLY